MERLIETLKKGDTVALVILLALLLGELTKRGVDRSEIHQAVDKAYMTVEKVAAN